MRRQTLLLTMLLVLVAMVAVAGCSGVQNKPGDVPRQDSGGTNQGGTDQGGTQGGATQGGAQVSMENFEFTPAEVTVKAGQSVTWTNNDGTTHTVTGSGGLDSGDIADGGTYTKRFDEPGRYTYNCSIHPSMRGTVVVQP